jgi:DNA invertase Pin-like site-specific DNA recombinase
MSVDTLRALVAGRGLSVEVGSAPKATPKKLTAEQETDIRKRFKNGESVSSLAKRFPVSRPTIDKCLPEKTVKAHTLESGFGISKPSKSRR